MAERSTAAVNGSAAGRSGPAEAADTADATSPTDSSTGSGDSGKDEVQVPDLHSGHKLADRYRLEECVTRLDGFSSWRAVDEKLRRAVGVHILAANYPRAHDVLEAARAAALIGDPRFVQVLDAVADDDVVYVVHEWLPDATELSTLLADGQPLAPHEAYELISQVAQALAAAHRKDLPHLNLTPSAALRATTGQWRIRGLAVLAALRGVTADEPQRTDTEAAGALLYAALTGRWPYEEDAYGLAGLPKQVGLIAPDQVRAGVHRGLSELAMRALAAGDAEAAGQLEPCTTPEELARAVAELPRIRPPEPQYAQPTGYRRTTYQQGYATRGAQNGAGRAAPPEAPVPPALPGRTGKAVKWLVSVLLIVALALGSWQLADALLNHDGRTDDAGKTQPVDGGGGGSKSGKPVPIKDAADFDPPPDGDGTETSRSVTAAYDGDTGTYWMTKWYTTAEFGNLKDGVGLVLDLGEPRQVGKLNVSLVGDTAVTAMATPRDASGMPTSLSGFKEFDSADGTNLTLKPTKPVVTQYVLLWLTRIPQTEDGNYRGRISDVSITS